MTSDVDITTPLPGRRSSSSPNGTIPVDVHELQQALEAMRAGDFSVRLTAGRVRPFGRIAVLFHENVGTKQNLANLL